MFGAYLRTFSWFDSIIVSFGFILMLAHGYGIYQNRKGKKIKYVQNLEQVRSTLLMLTEFLPILGMLGTVLSLMDTFTTFQVGTDGRPPDLAIIVDKFGPALSTTFSGQIMLIPNLVLNAIMWNASQSVRGQGGGN